MQAHLLNESYTFLLLLFLYISFICCRTPFMSSCRSMYTALLWCDIITLQCDILALVWLFGPANVTFWTCQCDFSALRLFPASDTLPRELKNIEIE